MSRSFSQFVTLFCLMLGLQESQAQEQTMPSDISEPGMTLYEVILGNIALGAGDNQTAFELLSNAAQKLNNKSVAELAWTAAVKTQSNQQIVEASKLWSTLDPSAQIANDALLLDAIKQQRAPQVEQYLKNLTVRLKDQASDFIAKFTRKLTTEAVDLSWTEHYLEPYWEQYASSPDVMMAQAIYKRKLGDDREACRAALSVIPGNGLIFRAKDHSWFAEHEEFATTTADICWSVMPEKSQKILETVILANPQSTVARLMHGKILARFGHTEAAIDEAKEAARLDPTSPMVLYNAGELAVECKDYELAKQFFNDYIRAGKQKNPDHDWSTDDVWLALALVYDHLEDYIGEAEALARYNPKVGAPDIRIRETAAWLKAGKPDTAESVLLAASDKDPNNERTYFNARMEILLKSNQVDKALNILHTILEKDPQNEDILYHLSLIYQQQGKTDEAVDALETILRINPNNALAANGLGYHYTQIGQQLPRARLLLENAYRQRPLDWQVLDSMAWLCFKEKRLDQAYYFALAAMKGGFHQEVVEHMIEILAVSQRTQEAQSVFDELKRRLPEDPQVLELGKRLHLTL